MADKIGRILIRKGKITTEQLQEALRTQQFFGGYLASHLIKLGYLDEASLGATLSEIHGVPCVPYEELRAVRRETASILPSSLALRFRAVPLQVSGNRLMIAIANPRDFIALAEIATVTGLKVAACVAPEFRIAQTIEKLYGVRPGGGGRRPILMKTATGLPRRSMGASPSAPSPPMETKRDVRMDGLPTDDEDRTDTTSLQESGEASSPGDTLPGSHPRSLKDWREMEERPPGMTPAGGVATPPATTIEEVVERLECARSREEVCRPIVEFLARHFRRSAMLAVLPDRVRVLDACGDGVNPKDVREVYLPAGLPSLFETLKGGSRFHLGPTSDIHPGTRLFFTALGGDPPRSVLVLPVLIRDRTVALLYADNRASEIGPVDLALWRRLSSLVAVALEMQLLRRKLRTI